jgi:hypothetical protein
MRAYFVKRKLCYHAKNADTEKHGLRLSALQPYLDQTDCGEASALSKVQAAQLG